MADMVAFYTKLHHHYSHDAKARDNHPTMTTTPTVQQTLTSKPIMFKIYKFQLDQPES